jgi:two-component system, response regulator PdtaR
MLVPWCADGHLQGMKAGWIMSANKSVLIIEDEFLIAEYVQTVLEDEGIAVAGTAANAASAKQLFEELNPAAIICDIRLGHEDGVELVRHLRQGRDVGVVFVSGLGDDETMSRILSAGPAGFIQKPMNPGILIKKVREALPEAA